MSKVFFDQSDLRSVEADCGLGDPRGFRADDSVEDRCPGDGRIGVDLGCERQPTPVVKLDARGHKGVLLQGLRLLRDIADHDERKEGNQTYRADVRLPEEATMV